LQTTKAPAAKPETSKRQAGARNDPGPSTAKPAKSANVSGLERRTSVQR
jgi:hypothetical protein